MASLQDEIAERNRKIEEVLEHPEALEAFHECLDGFYREEFPSGEDHQVKLRWTIEGILRIYFLLRCHDLVGLSGDVVEEEHLDRLSGVLRRITLAVHGLIKGLHQDKVIAPFKVFDLDWQEGVLFPRRHPTVGGRPSITAAHDWTLHGHLLVQANAADRHGSYRERDGKPSMPTNQNSVYTFVRPARVTAEGQVQSPSAVLTRTRSEMSETSGPNANKEYHNPYMTSYIDYWTSAPTSREVMHPPRFFWRWHWGYNPSKVVSPEDIPKQLLVPPARLLARDSTPRSDGTIEKGSEFKFSPEAIQVAFQTSGFLPLARDKAHMSWAGPSGVVR
ncbi:hypothetical protein JCM11641_005636 [Rhodosporidiobolus odoratus]